MSILRKIWGAWAVVCFFIILIFSLPFYLLTLVILPKRFSRWAIWWSHRVYARVFFWLTLIWISVKGKELLDPDQTYIIISNHYSNVDFMANPMAYPGLYKYLAKSELKDVPLAGFVFERLAVLVDRKDAVSRKESVERLKDTLADKFSVLLYPEGTRNQTAEHLAPFYDGAFRIAIETQTPIAIQIMTNLKTISKTLDELDLFPGILKIEWAKPIPTVGLTMEDLPKLKAEVRAVMQSALERNAA